MARTIAPEQSVRVPKSLRPPNTRARSAKRAKSFEPDVASAFGAIVRAERLKMGVAQDQFALLANVDRSYFGKLERGERQPSLGLLLRIAGALQITGGEIVKRVEKQMAQAGTLHV